MRMSWIVAVGGACLLTPVVASAQQRQGAPPTASDSGKTGQAAGHRAKATADSATATAEAAVSGAAAAKPSGDPKMVGTPAWWSTHATADGKPKAKGESAAKPKKSGQ